MSLAALPPGTDLSKFPLSINPSGAAPNFVDPPALVGTVQGVGITLAIISLVLLCLRLGIYVRLNRTIVLDDISIVIGFMLAAGYTGMVCSMGKSSRHSWDTPLSFIDEEYMKKLFATSLFYGPMLFFTKTSILLLYLRAFRTTRWLRVGVYISLVILFVTYWMTVALGIVYCMPHNGKPWDFAVLSNCNHLATPGLVQGGMNIAADLTIFLLPLPIIFKLQIPTGKKIALSGVFATGIFALTASVLTIYYRVRIVRGFDATWATAQTYVCIQAEVYAAICVACMPSLARFWNIKFKETRFYATLQSLLHTVRGTQSRSAFSKSSRKGAPSSDSISHLQKDAHYSEINNGQSNISIRAMDGDDRSQKDLGIHQMVTIGVSSENRH